MSKLLINYTLCSVMVIAPLGISHAQQDQNSQLSDQDQARKYIQLRRLAMQPDGLHKAALANGGKYVLQDAYTDWIVAASLADLVRECKVVAIVKITNQETHLGSNGRGIGTYYKFNAPTVLKGALPYPSLYSIALPGGSYTFSDKSMAVVETPKVPKMRVGGTYLVFINPSSNSPQTLVTVFQSQGIFELLDDGVTVRHLSMKSGDELKKKYDKESQAQLLSDTREAIFKK